MEQPGALWTSCEPSTGPGRAEGPASALHATAAGMCGSCTPPDHVFILNTAGGAARGVYGCQTPPAARRMSGSSCAGGHRPASGSKARPAAAPRSAGGAPGSCMPLKGVPSGHGMAAFAQRAAAALEIHATCTFATCSGSLCIAMPCMHDRCVRTAKVNVHVHAGDRGAGVAAAEASRAAQSPPRLARPWAAARPGRRAQRLAAGHEQRPLLEGEQGRRSGCAAIPRQARRTGSWQLHQPCMSRALTRN